MAEAPPRDKPPDKPPEQPAERPADQVVKEEEAKPPDKVDVKTEKLEIRNSRMIPRIERN